MTAYLYIYNNWRIYELPWDSAVTWVVAAILCDLGYYWVHRAAHGKLVVYFQCFKFVFFWFASSDWNFSLAHMIGVITISKTTVIFSLYSQPQNFVIHSRSWRFLLGICISFNSDQHLFGCNLNNLFLHLLELNILWAAHQVHHSSEDYNLTTAFRQSMIMKFGNWPFYLPMAFFVPPTQLIVHVQFNLLYQFWIHTELVKDIGPLEYILNSAKHHRVHHGNSIVI